MFLGENWFIWLTVYFYYPSANVVLEALCIWTVHKECSWVCLCVCVCVCVCVYCLCILNVVVKQYLKRYWIYFHQTVSVGAFWDKDEAFKFWGQKDKVQGHGGSIIQKNVHFGLVNAESWKLLDWIFPDFQHWDSYQSPKPPVDILTQRHNKSRSRTYHHHAIYTLTFSSVLRLNFVFYILSASAVSFSLLHWST